MLRTALSSTLRRAVTAAPRVAPRMAPQPALRWARPAEFSSAPALFGLLARLGVGGVALGRPASAPLLLRCSGECVVNERRTRLHMYTHTRVYIRGQFGAVAPLVWVCAAATAAGSKAWRILPVVAVAGCGRPAAG